MHTLTSSRQIGHLSPSARRMRRRFSSSESNGTHTRRHAWSSECGQLSSLAKLRSAVDSPSLMSCWRISWYAGFCASIVRMTLAAHPASGHRSIGARSCRLWYQNHKSQLRSSGIQPAMRNSDGILGHNCTRIFKERSRIRHAAPGLAQRPTEPTRKNVE